MRRLLILFALTSVVVAVAMPSAVTVAGAPPFTKWGWVTVRDPSPGQHIPATADRATSVSQGVRYSWQATGGYAVQFRGLADPGGVAFVTTLSASGNSCQVLEWGAEGNYEDVFVGCFAPNGTRSDTRFTVSFLATNSDAGPLGYMFNDVPDSTHNADPRWSYNSNGLTNRVETPAVGVYTVKMPGIGADSGNVVVSAVGGAALGTCLPDSSGVVGAHAESINIYCFDASGAPADTRFTVSYMRDEGLKGHGRAAVAYLWADRPFIGSYVPSEDYRYSSAGMEPTITHSGVGAYTVSLPGMPAGGTVQVGSFKRGARCNVSGIQTVTPQRVGVRCWDMATASPKSAMFVLSYEK